MTRYDITNPLQDQTYLTEGEHQETTAHTHIQNKAIGNDTTKHDTNTSDQARHNK